MEQVKKYFDKKFEKTGIALTNTQLYNYAKENKLKDVTKKSVSNFLNKQEHVSHFSPTKKVKVFQTIGVPRIGLYHLDYGEFHKSWSGSNAGNTGFLVAVENFTNRLFVIPCRGKDTKQWLNAVEKFVELTRVVRTIFTDRDSVATSRQFRTRIAKEYNISWYFLKKGNKSYLAERYIGFAKQKLSQALLKKGGKNWIRFVPDLCKEYNTVKIPGTSYRRQAVSKENFNHFLGQLLKTDDPELTFNSFKAGPFANKKWNKKIFKFDLGQKVLLGRKANWKEAEEKAGIFKKASVVGGYGAKKYTISGRQLRGTKKKKPTFVAVYALQEFGSSLHFYTEELKAAE